MGKAVRYAIAGRVFESQKEVVATVRGILHRYPPGSVVNEHEREFLIDLLQHHPRATAKIGVGVRDIQVQPNPVWKGSPMFVIIRLDGTQADFSYRKCLRAPFPLADFFAACRETVVDEVLDFKTRVFENYANLAGLIRCPLTGRWVGWDDVHVDHAPPWTFWRIVAAFVTEAGIDPLHVNLRGFNDGEVQKKFADRRLAERFLRFHNSRAQLRVIEASHHLRLSK